MVRAIVQQKLNKFWQSFARGWRNFQIFATDKFEGYWRAIDVSDESEYTKKIRFYAYLLLIEEQ
jgi:hypothetical protein